MAEDNLLLPAVVDLRALTDPQRLFCALVLSTTDVEQDLRLVSYSDYANAVNSCAWWLDETLGKADDRELPTVGYLGPPDLRQTIVALAAAKTNRKTLLVSPRNSTEGQLKLLEATRCRVLITAQDVPALYPLVATLTAKVELQIVPFGATEYWLDQPKAPVYPFYATLEKDASRPFAILHTSGSTGFPELATYTFGAMAGYRTFLEPQKVIPGARPTMVDLWKNKVTYVAFPTSHMVGFLTSTAFNVYWGMTPILGPATVAPNPALAAKIHALSICKSTVLPVSVLEPLAEVPEYLEGLGSLDLAIWCGSSWSSSVAPEKIRPLVTISAGYGATEAGPFVTEVESQDDHEYMSFSPLMGAELRSYTDDLYEMVIVRDPRLEGAQHIFSAFPELAEWHSKDLFSKHPTKAGLWQYSSRTDDIQVLSSGANVNPILMEGAIMAYPQVVSALLVGTGRPETAWLIEVKQPPASKEETEALIQEIWPAAEHANDVAHHGKVTRDKIIFTSRVKPMSRAAKGTVQRKATVLAYKEELDALYK